MSFNSEENTNIKVYCRFSPLNEKEKIENPEETYNFTSDKILNFHSQEKNIYNFNFDKIFPFSSTQQDIYDSSAKNIINNVLEGYNGTIIVYGGRGSGKTYTIQGKNEKEATKGIIPRMIQDIFDYIYNNENELFLLKVSIMEITYQEKIKDLININNSNINLRMDNSKKTYIEGLSEHYVNTQEDIISFLNIANNNREQLYLNLDDFNNKGHFIFILNIFKINKKEGIVKNSKLFLVEIGGFNKNQKLEENTQFIFDEKISNNSLSTLRKVISNLSNKQMLNIPYKESILTQLLEESLGGNAKTCFILTCLPSKNNETENLNTLRLGEKIRKIKNNPIINKKLTYEQLKKTIEELNEKIKKKDLRISQLEQFINLNELQIPKYNENINENKNIKIKIKKNDINIEDNINKILESLKQKNNADLNNNTNIIDEIINIKDKYILNINNLNKKIKALEEEININKEIKYKLQQALIEKQTKNIENSFSSKNDNNTDCLKLFSEFIINLKKYQEIQNNPKIFEDISEFENKIKSLENENDIIKNIINNNEYIIEKQFNYQYTNIKKEIEDKDIQTDIEEEEMIKIQIEFENEKKYLMNNLENNKQIILELKEEIIELQNKNKDLENNIPLNEKKIKDKNIILENNLRELKKKYEESQIKRLLLEDNYRKLNKYFQDQKGHLNNIQNEIKEIKVNVNHSSNVIKIIPGGQKEKI